MGIPTWDEFLLPLLTLAGDGDEHLVSAFRPILAEQFRLSAEELAELLPSGRQSRFNNRVGWARTALTKSGLLARVGRGSVQITPAGGQLLAEHPGRITARLLLDRYPGFREYRASGGQHMDESAAESLASELTAEERIEQAHQQVRAATAADLLSRLRQGSPSFFEQAVVQLLVKLGYGGPSGDGVVLGKTGDGGVDGVIRGDKLGLDEVYVQAKRWEGTVGAPVVQQFAGALAGRKANKGVVITTSSFSSAAIDYVSQIAGRIALVDGQTLAELMIDVGLGVSVTATYPIWRVDPDFFGDD